LLSNLIRDFFKFAPAAMEVTLLWSLTFTSLWIIHE